MRIQFQADLPINIEGVQLTKCGRKDGCTVGGRFYSPLFVHSNVGGQKEYVTTNDQNETINYILYNI